jgi:beta-glucosidase
MSDALLPAARELTPAQQVSLLSGGDFWRTQPLPEAGIPSCVMSDGPHGLRFQPATGDNFGTAASERATCFPTAVTMASTWDEALVAEVADAVAVEALAQASTSSGTRCAGATSSTTPRTRC